jgi:hypothetical protein
MPPSRAANFTTTVRPSPGFLQETTIMPSRRLFCGLALVLATGSALGADAPRTPKGELVIETDAKGRVTIRRTTSGGSTTLISPADDKRDSARYAVGGNLIVTADSFRLTIRDGVAREVELRGRVKVDGDGVKAGADRMILICDEALVPIDAPKPQR